MKKRGFLIYLILGILFLPGITFAKSYSGNAGAARSAVMNTSNTYYYTAWTSLNTNSLNIVPVPYSGGDYYLMGSEYSFAVTMTGDTYFSGHVTIPVAANTIYNYTLTNGLSDTDMRFGIDQNFGVYNVNAIINSANWYCNVYEHLGVAHTYCYYDIYFHFSLPEALNGAYNLNVAVLNLASNRSAYYYSGYDSNGCAIEFPMAASNSGYPDMRAYMDMSSSGGQSGSPDNTEEILEGVSEAADSINDTIQESYENLVKSQEVCTTTDIYNSSIFQEHCSLSSVNGNPSCTSNTSAWNYTYGVTDYLLVTNINILRSNYNRPICFYDSNKTLISCTNVSSYSSVPDGSVYVRTDMQLTYSVPFIQVIYCQNGNQALYDEFHSIKGSILDETIENFKGSQGLDDIGGQMTTDTPITDLLALPITLLSAIVTGVNGTCSDFNLGNLWGTNLVIPCINPELYIGTDLWNLIDLLFCGFMIFNIAQLMIHDYSSISSAQDLFDETYTPRHEKMRRS